MTTFLTVVIAGLSVGSIYALLALGYAMIHTVTGMGNFAQGDFAMPGAMLFTIFLVGSAVPLSMSFVFVGITAVILALIVVVVIYRPVFNGPRINLFMTGIAASLIIENAAAAIWGSQTRYFPSLWGGHSVKVLGARVPMVTFLLLGSLAVLTAAGTYMLKRTRLGVAMRASAEDWNTAILMGIPVQRVTYMTFAFGGVLSAVSIVGYGMYFGVMWPLVGFDSILKAFVATIFGGLGSLPGAVVGGFAVGLLESVGSLYVSTGYQNAISFGLLVVILLIRPRGLFGKVATQKA